MLIYSQCRYSLLALYQIAHMAKVRSEYKQPSIIPEQYYIIDDMCEKIQGNAGVVVVIFYVNAQSGSDIRIMAEKIIQAGKQDSVCVLLFGLPNITKMASHYLDLNGISTRTINKSATVLDMERNIWEILRTKIVATTSQSRRLSQRERIILSMSMKGESPGAISCGLGIDRKTVYTHRRAALRKLGCDSYWRGLMLFRNWG